MNKKITLLTAVFMAVSIFRVSAAFTVGTAEVDPAGYTVGNYYYLQTGTTSSNYLALSGEKADSVIVKTAADFGTNPSKASMDSALWQITSAGTTPAGALYQFKNKKTQAVLSFAAAADAKPNLAAGIDKWTFTDGKIKAYYGKNALMSITVDNSTLSLSSATNATAATFKVMAPDTAYVLDAPQLGNSFTVFQLQFGETYRGDIFTGKDILATDLKGDDSNYVTLKVQGDETYPDGKEKLFGLDTTKTVISGAKNVFGASFVRDSTYTGKAGGNPLHSFGNADFQKFKFTVDLKNDYLAMYVKAAPGVNNTPLDSIDSDVRVVYASVAATKVLTVAKVGSTDNAPEQGATPLITVKKGTPASIPTGTGVYFLKSASKTETGGKYIRAYDKNAKNLIVMADSVPTAFQPKGQWYIKENGGMYSIVDRNTNTSIIMNEQIFAVQGMANTYTFGANTDSITVVASTVDFANKFLGTRRFTKDEMANNAYALNLISGTPGVYNLYVTSADTMLQVKSGSATDAIDLKLVVSADSTKYTDGTSLGAQALGDTLYYATYTLKEKFSNKVVALDTTKKALKLTSFVPANVFTFNAATTGDKYTMTTDDKKNVSMDVSTSSLILTGNVAYFKFVSVEAPEYASVTDGHKMFMSNAQYLAMNPLNFWAEMKKDGQPIVKANYNKDNFAFWLARAKASTDAKPLYLISKVDPASDINDDTAPRYYMVSFADSTDAKYKLNGAARVGFVSRDTIATMDNSPAVFALKTTEDGSYLLENQRDLSKNTGKQYVANSNGFLVMSAVGATFEIENTSGPVANDKIETTDVVVTTSTGTLTVKNAAGKRVTLSNILGQSLGSYNITSDLFTLPASRGIVIVTIADNSATESLKVLVK